MNEYAREILDLTKGVRKYFDISGTKHFIPQHIPVFKQLHSNIITPLFRASIGDVIRIKAFLKSSNLTLSSNVILEFESKFGVGLQNGYSVYEISSAGGIPTSCLVLSSIGKQPLSDLPIEMEIKKLGISNGKIIFYLKDWEPSVLDISGIEAPAPNLALMRNSVLEVMPSLSKTNIDLHVVDSIISPYVGSDTLSYGVDGIGSSYVGDISESLKTIHQCIIEPEFLPSVSSFGVVNFLGNKTIQEIEELRKAKTKLRALSWNINSKQDLSNLKSSDFKYIVDGSLEVDRVKNLENNLDFQQSLILLTSKDKSISQRLFGSVVNTATGQINGWLEKGEKQLLHKILDINNIGSTVARLASFHIAFEPDEKKAIKEIDNTISQNIEDNIIRLRENLVYTKGKEYGHEVEKSLDPKVISSFYKTDGSPEEIIRSMMENCGYSENKANEILKKLIETGLVYSPDGGKHYRWSRDSQLKFKK